MHGFIGSLSSHPRAVVEPTGLVLLNVWDLPAILFIVVPLAAKAESMTSIGALYEHRVVAGCEKT